ncbi:hypothetical protein ASF74_14970 [Arthrobacter sp. Leaf145]|nr:hypothetical protein ASF74_14970 [Arthrobacter sp. Leaf145]
MADRRVKVTFSAEIQGFKSAMEEAARATEKTKKATEDAGKAADTHLGKMVQSATKNSDAWERTGAVTAGAGAAMVAGVGLAIKSYADFDKQMSSVQAATHATAGDMNQLRDAAVKAGADTAFSAVEAAQGIEELAKAGVSTKDIMGGGLKGSLDLAAAGSLGVAEAAEISASALTQFKLSGDKIPHLADLLAAGAGKAQGSVSDLGAALNQSGLVAASTGLTIEETTGSLAAFASAGLTGSDAGTSFKTMLMSLNPNSEAAAKLMKDLGISAYDAQGKFVGMSEYAGILQNALKGMSDEQRNATLKTLFGSDAVRAANVLYEQGAAGINKWEAAVNDAGYAAETAAIKQDNLAGDIEKLGGSMDSVFLKSGSGANDFLRGLAQGAEDAVDWIGQIPGPVLSTSAAIAGVVGVAALGAGAFLNLTPKVLESVQAFDKLAPAGSKARGALAGVGKAAGGAMAIGALTLVVAKLAESDYMSKIDTGMGRVANVLSDVARNSPDAASGLDSLFKNKEGKDLINNVNDLDSALKRTFRPDAGRQFNDWGEGLVNTFTGVKGSSQILGDTFKRIDEQMASLVSSGSATDAAKIFDRLKERSGDLGISVDELKKKFPEYADALQKADADSKSLAATTGQAKGAVDGLGGAAVAAKPSAEDLAKALEDVGLSADGSVVSVEKWTQSLFNAGLLSLSASNAAIGYQAAIDAVTESVKVNGTTLDINTEQGRANQTAFNGVASAAMAAMTATAEETLATQGSTAAQAGLQSALRTSYNDLVAAAGQFGIVGDEADTMARKALGVPKNVNIDAWVNDQATARLDAVKAKAESLDGKQSTVTITTVERIQRNYETTGTPGAVGGQQQVLGGASGGRVADILGFWGGGRLPYARPSDMSKDNLIGYVNGGKPIALQGQEWVINGRSSDRYDSELAAINAGTFPKLKEYSAQSLGYAPAAASTPMQSAVPDVRVFIGNEQINAHIEYVSSAVVTKADSASKHMRTGRQ